MMDIRAKDYLVVDDQLYFAVVSDHVEAGRALTWLRYLRDEHGMRKLDTREAASYIKQFSPEYCFHSATADIELHGIPLTDIQQVLKPQQAVRHLLELSEPDAKQAEAIHLLRLLTDNHIPQDSLGITGSLLLNAHSEQSDIDLLVYGRDIFHATRKVVTELMTSGDLKPLSADQWRSTFTRRDCSLTFNEYLWHEQRKHNKCCVGHSRVDISMLPWGDELSKNNEPAHKVGQETIMAKVINDRFAFDFPARLLVQHSQIDEIVIFTATYIGQALQGEVVEASGVIEQVPSGTKRLVIGTSREAKGEYLKVMQTEQQK